MFGFRARSQRGVTSVEYGVIVAGISLVTMIGAGSVGTGVSSSFCATNKALGGSTSCASASASGTPSPSGTPAPQPSAPASAPAPTDTPAPTGAPTPSTSASAAPATSSVPSVTSSPSATASTSPGSMAFYSANIGQDDVYPSDLSVRMNLAWSPNDWNQPTYPTTMTVEVTWSPALAVDKVVTGSDGSWTYTLVGAGKMRLTRTGSFDNSGFQPEPEILLVKPKTQQLVQASFSASAPNSPTITSTASTTSIPY